MSATQDKTQKITFVYSNLYQIYKKGKEAAQAAPVSAPAQAPIQSMQAEPAHFAIPASARKNVLKTGDLHQQAAVRIEEYSPTQFIGKRVARPAYLPPARSEAVESLKQNLKTLNDLHSRLRFMLQELEDLVKE